MPRARYMRVHMPRTQRTRRMDPHMLHMHPHMPRTRHMHMHTRRAESEKLKTRAFFMFAARTCI